MTKALVIAGLIAGVVVLRALIDVSPGVATGAPAASPLYRSSVVGTDFDFITQADPDSFRHLEYIGFQQFEMPDKRNTGKPLVQNAYVFKAYFADGSTILFALDEGFGSKEAAEIDVRRYPSRVGRLPSIYRENLKHIVVHSGGEDTTSFAEDKGHFFVIYSGNATKRISTNDLEETFFHEATHASIQDRYLKGAAWEKAKASDRSFITDYATTEDQEDFAESALFAYTVIHHPERFPADELKRIREQIPNRIEFFRGIFQNS